MSDHKTLLQFLLDLLHDKQALADFQDDPKGELHAAGLDHVCVQDIQDLLPVVLEKEDPDKAARYEDDCDHDRCHDDTPNQHEHHGSHHDGDPDHDDHRWHHDHDSEIDKVVTHLNYVTNNYSYDSHDTIFNTKNDTEIKNNIWAGKDSTVSVNNEVHNDTHNVAPGGVSVEGDNSAPIATGGHNQIGNGNEMSGDGSTTAFGSGNATRLDHVSTGQGGVISTGSGTVNSSNAFGHGNQVSGANGVNTDSHAESNSHNATDNHAITDSQNHTSTDSHDSTDNSVDSSSTYKDSYNTHTEDDHHQTADHGGHVDSAALLPVL